MKTIGIYHDRDLDGLACAAIMKLRFPGIELVGWDYSYNPEDFFDKYDLRGCEVYMADVSMPLEAMKMIAAEADTFVWIDHHEKALAEIGPEMPHHTNVVFDRQLAACEIAWNWFFPDQETPEIISSLGAYDVWRKDDPDRHWEKWILPVQMYYNAHWETAIEEIKHDLYLRGHGAGEWDRVLAIVSDGIAMLKFEKSQIRRAISSRNITDQHVVPELRTTCCYIVNATVNPGRLADEVWRAYPDVEVVIMYYRTKDSRWKYSMRSQDHGPNVAAIAGMYGGGGHPNAAAFLSKNLFFE